jgi:aminotransferase
LIEFETPARLRGIEKSQIRQLFDRAPPGSINLGLGEPDLLTPDIIRRAAVKVILEEQNGYTTHSGLRALRELVAGDYPYLQRDPDGVIITAGSQEALYLALMTIVGDGDEVLLPDPGFVAYPTITRMAGGRPVFYRLSAKTGFSFDIEEFRQRLSPRTKVVIVISPSNPTGRTLVKSDLIAISEVLKDTGVVVVSDEIYRDIYYTCDRPASLSDYYQKTLVIGGLSKSMSMTGWRLGWLCGDLDLVRNALVLHGYVTTCASTVSQKAALAAWDDEAISARQAIRATFHKRRDYLLESLNLELGLSAIVPDGAFYTMVDVRDYGSSMEVAEALLKQRVITVPGGAFGSEGEGFLRISYCADIAVISEAVRRMSEGLEKMLEGEVRG